MFGIDDALMGAVAGPLIGGLLGGFGGGSAQGGTTTQKNEPWAPAQPWLTNNLQTGQQLQNFYQANPFNQQQQAAYGNLASGTDYMNRLTPGLLAQFGQQGGFDRNNPSARPAPFSFFAPQGQPQGYGGAMQPSAPQARSSGGFFGGMPSNDMNMTQNPFANGAIPAQAPAQSNIRANSVWDMPALDISGVTLGG